MSSWAELATWLRREQLVKGRGTLTAVFELACARRLGVSGRRRREGTCPAAELWRLKIPAALRGSRRITVRLGHQGRRAGRGASASAARRAVTPPPVTARSRSSPTAAFGWFLQRESANTSVFRRTPFSRLPEVFVKPAVLVTSASRQDRRPGQPICL